MRKIIAKIENWIEQQRILIGQQNCEHKEWDMDVQIKVIECRKCGKKAWVKDIRNLYRK